jgi:hypothetical protein
LADPLSIISEPRENKGKPIQKLTNLIPNHNSNLNLKYRWLELVFNPRNQFEQVVSKTLRMLHPYLAFVTYRFHVEKAREAGNLSFTIKPMK